MPRFPLPNPPAENAGLPIKAVGPAHTGGRPRVTVWTCSSCGKTSGSRPQLPRSGDLFRHHCCHERHGHL